MRANLGGGDIQGLPAAVSDKVHASNSSHSSISAQLCWSALQPAALSAPGAARRDLWGAACTHPQSAAMHTAAQPVERLHLLAADMPWHCCDVRGQGL